MPDVVVSWDELTVGELPRVCVVTGAPAVGTVPMRFSSMPSWMYAFGALPVLLTTQDLEGFVPVAEGVIERHTKRQRLAAVAAIVTALLLAAAFIALLVATMDGPFTDQVPTFVGGFLVVGVVVGVLSNRGGTFIDARPDKASGGVRLIGVHADFAAAVAASRRQHAGT